MEALRVAAYARVSTSNQLLEHDSSLDTQLLRIRQSAAYRSDVLARHDGKKRPWKISHEYREEGKSAKDTERPRLQELLADIRAGRVDVVCVTKIDRITRSVKDFYELWETFQEHGVEFVSLGEDFDTTSAMGRAMLTLTLVFAQLERETTSERTRDKISARREQGLWHGGYVPLGYRLNPQNPTTIDVDEANATLVRKQFFERYLKLKSARALVRYLAENGIRRPTRKSKRGRTMGGSDFTIQSVIDLLSNPTYVAKRTLEDGRVIDCVWQAIISQDLFDRVQARLAANSEVRPTGRKALDHIYLLEGLLVCGGCGASMTRSVANGVGGQYHYYKCSRKARTAHSACKVRDIPVNAVENFVIDQLRNYSLNPDAIRSAVHDANAGRDEALAKVEDELQQKKTAYLQASKLVAKLLDTLEGDDGAALDSLRARLREREAAKNKLKIEVGDLEAKRQVLRQQMLDAITVIDSYSKLPFIIDRAEKIGARDELKTLLQTVLEVVEWRQSPEDPKRGEALIKLRELSPGFWAEAPNEERPDERVNSSPGRVKWLPDLDSNQGHGD